jgi:hypothetical protein
MNCGPRLYNIGEWPCRRRAAIATQISNNVTLANTAGSVLVTPKR